MKDGSGATLESYTLDEEGNRALRLASGVHRSKRLTGSFRPAAPDHSSPSHLASFHVTDVANRLTEDEKHQFEYDANGNMVRKTVKATGATWRYSYTVWDELASASRHASADSASPITEKVSYTFDALGRRVSERRYDGGGALTGGTNFHYDGEEVAHEVAVDATGVLIAGSAKWTTHSDGVDDLLSVIPQAGTGPSSPTAVTSGAAMPSANSYYYHADHQGSVRAITDQSGTITNTYAYDSYGTAEESVESLAQRFRYTGREFDARTGLYHYRARAYDPETARFLQEDPLHFDALDLNIYRYAFGNPVEWTDASGWSPSISYGRMSAWAVQRAGQQSLAAQSKFGCAFSLIGAALDLAQGEYITGVQGAAEGCTLNTAFRKGKAGSGHGNSAHRPGHDNHVYVIMDSTSFKIRKIGISLQPLKTRKDSPRARQQLEPGETQFVIGYNLTRSQALAVECGLILAHRYAFPDDKLKQGDRCVGVKLFGNL